MIVLFILFLFLFAHSKMLDVPFVKQRDHFCGPASLSSVLSFYGIPVPQERIAEETYDPRLKGALITDLEKYAKHIGFRAEVKQGSLQEIKTFVDMGVPPIVLVDIGRLFVSTFHYMVVVGYEGDTFILHTGYEEAKRIRAEELDRMWSKTGRVMLLVYPP